MDTQQGLDSQQEENLEKQLTDIIENRQPKGVVSLDAALNSVILTTLRMYYRNPDLLSKFIDSTTGFTYAFDDAGWFNLYDVNSKLGEERLSRIDEGKELGKKIREQHEREELAALRIAATPTKEQLAGLNLASIETIGTFDTEEIEDDWGIVFMENPDVLLTIDPGPNTIQLFGSNSKMLVSIDMETGEIEYGEDYTPDEAAQVFWNALGHYHPNNYQVVDRECSWSEFDHKEETSYDSAMSLLGSYNG